MSLNSCPRQRSSGLMIKPLADETLVYDLTTHRATCLNACAATVWQLCDGTRDLAALMRDSGIDNDAVLRQTMQKLADADLLIDVPSVDRYDDGVDTGRRAALGKMAAGLAMAAPLVTTMTVPIAAQAASCTENGGACGDPSECCSGFCFGVCGEPG